MRSLEIEAQINELYGKIAENKLYLTNTDYIIIRDTETGVVIPEDIRLARAQARDRINAFEAQIEDLKVELVEAVASEQSPAESSTESAEEAPAETPTEE